MSWEKGGKNHFTGAQGNVRRDELTGLPLMAEFLEQAEQRLAYGPAAFLYFNIENFRMINRRYGIKFGNQLLLKIAQALEKRYSDGLVARLTDDRFIVMTDVADISNSIDAVQSELSQINPQFSLAVKIGAYEPPADLTDVSLIMDRAKLACDSIKGVYDRGVAWFVPELEEQLNLRMHLVTHFEEALQKGWIEVFFQPEIRTLTQEVCGFEALARWRDPEYGLISPGVFIPVLEEAHLIDSLDLYVVRRVCERLRIMMKQEDCGITHVSVNLSRIDFELNDMLGELESICDIYKIPHELLHIEITESALYRSDDYFQHELARLREHGFELWMDDFGSGYSSLNNLKDYQFDVLKIDMAFLRDFDTKPQSRVILSAIVDMAKKLELHTLAEGVENREQYEFLRSIGCETIQGYLFSKPVPFDDIMPILNNESQDLLLEDYHDADFYRTIGAVNVLSTQPLHLPGETEAAHPVRSGIGIMEINQGQAELLYCSRELEELLRLADLATPDIAMATYQYDDDSDTEPGSARFWELARRCRRTHGIEYMENVMNGTVFSLEMRCIRDDRAENRSVYVYRLTNLSQLGIGPHGPLVETAVRHLLQIYTRIDLFTEDGLSENIVVDATQERVMDLDMLSTESLRRYADMYIAPEDRERFLEFYDTASVVERSHRAHNRHVTSIFRVCDEASGQKQLQMFIIVPFRMEGKWCYLSCVRRIDNMDEASPWFKTDGIAARF